MIGEGGMGEVYRASDCRLSRDVALKVLPPEIGENDERMIRFATEARSASALNHPNIVTIYEVGGSGDRPYIAMELIDGVTLRSLVAEGPLPAKKAFAIATQLAEGLAKAHAAGIVHRDLKPENVMITKDGFVKILDFGLAKLTERDGVSGSRSLTGTGLVVGTADYMSPEQAMDRPIDFRSDQFSLGLLLYEIATGRRPFVRESVVQTLSAIIQEEAEPIERLNPRMPAPFCWLVERCLAKDPAERYVSTADLAMELKQMRDRLASASEVVESRTSVSRSGYTRFEPAASRTALPAAAPRTKKERVLSVGVPALVGLALFAVGSGAGYLVRTEQADAPPPVYEGELLLGGATRVFAPLVSPDGTRLAFLALVNGVAQVAVMTPGSGDWVVLTKRRDVGSVNRIDWARDGTRLYFDRVSDIPAGVFSMPALGGEERLVLPDAQGPESLPDGSLLAVKVDAERNFQIQRFWPDTGKLDKIGPPFVRDAAGLPLRAFPDGKDAIVYARSADGSARFRAAYLLSLETGRLRRFAPELALAPPFTVGKDGRFVIADSIANDLHRLVRVSRAGDDVKTLLTLEARPWYVSAAADGTLYVALIENPVELLRFPREGGAPERLASSARNVFMHPVAFPDARVLLPGLVSGRKRLLAAPFGEPLRPFLETAESSSPPVALVGDSLAFLSGGAGKELPILALASPEGRIVKRFEETRGATPIALAASPDGKALYYVDAGFLYRLELAGGAPRRLRPANGVAVDPRGGLVVQLDDKDGVRLVRVPETGGAEQPITTRADLRLSPSPIAGNAVAPDGTILVSVTSKENWFAGPALLSPDGTIRRIPVQFDGSILPSAWGGGSILGMGEVLKSELWRFRPTAPRL
jgi:hypothetical protein